ncbi:PAS domain S-box protein [Anabaena cylindrica FACHB-243]|uniref:histidine kinase n=1 Tax=Anabaena cylindrica (strain ATCC 27899 / PCC 7122) TaxID=272123 RepID=K9ZLV9_ANACC|nr:MULTISPECIES: PAS domain S-box protein [Anabaena]AFZ60213.1 multi-sensor signal transduction histidine kinase [Anabaena cylindrica PCC 7122]MBD2417734.1 PAS domain S-box protein [Anabaena cylindrica FACHB-243]MBY5281311.1 PAS domain S-box protein [Anabaena sp. CCAP 1446/1C]MBY5306876.1 PAS domain S-box protein [Anabaena sp. CCAP 1446/1C]MCM2404649.1 PAS domain S-box protein [Anabaena sp. CCAP 1446/1C]
MQASPHYFVLKSLKSVIYCSALTVTPETYVLDVIAAMPVSPADRLHQNGAIAPESISPIARQYQCVLIKSASEIVGCLTPQDIVQLVASGADLKNVQISEVMQTSVIKLNMQSFNTLTTVISSLSQSKLQLFAVVDEQDRLNSIITPEGICLALEAVPLTAAFCNGVHRADTLHSAYRKNGQIVENQLLQSQQMLQLIIDTIPHNIFWKDVNSVFLGCNRNFAKMVGLENPQDIVGKTDYDLVANREQADFYRSCDAQVMKTNQPQYQTITPHQQADGKQLWLETNKVPLYNNGGNVVGILGTLENITEQKQALDALEKSEERFRFLAESIPQQVWIARPDGSLEYINQRTLDYFACTAEQILNWKWQEWVHPDDLPNSLTAWNISLATGTNYEVEFRLLQQSSGTYRWHLGRALALRNQQGQIINWFGTNTDIHDRVTAEVALRDSERRYHTIAKVSPVGLFCTDAAGHFHYANDRWCEIAGRVPDKIGGMTWVSTIHPEDQERIQAEWDQSVTQNLSFCSEYRFQHPNGEVRWVVGQIVAECSESGEEITYIGTVTDISEKQAVLRDSEAIRRNHQRVEAALVERVRLADFRSEVDAILTQTETLENMMRGCTDALVKHLHAAFARIWILNTEEQVLELQVNSGKYTDIDENHRLVAVGQFKIGLIAQEGKPHLTNSVQDDPHISNQEWAKQEGIVAFAGYPLIVEGETIGVIAMFSCQALTENTFSSMGIVADEIALGIKRKQTEAALRESEERFRNLVEATTDWVWEVDENCIYTYVSPKVRDILGYEPQEVLGKQPFELMPPAEAERVIKIFLPLFEDRQSFKCVENIQYHQDGHLVVMETNGVPIFDVDGNFGGYRGIDRDITIRKQEAAKLWEMQQQLQAILDNFPAVMYLLDPENKYLLVNHQYEKLFNITQAQIVGKSVYDVWPHDVAQAFAVSNSQVMAGGIPLEIEEVAPHPDGLHTYLSVKFPLKDVNDTPYAVCSISTDITSRKRDQEELRQSEEYFRLLVEGVKDYAIYMLDPEGRVMSWNSGAECITGYQASEIIGRDFSCFFRPEDVLSNIPKQQLKIAAINGRCECESVFLRKDGSHFWANCILTPLHDETGKQRGFSKVTRDITERKLTEKSLLRLHKAIESTSDAISITDITGKAVYVNPAFVEVFDYTFSQLNSCGGLSANFTKQETFNQVFKTVQRGEPWRGEITMQTRGHHNVQVDLRIDAIKDSTNKIVSFVSIYTDITQRKLIEEGLRLRDRAIAASSNGIVIADVTSPDSSIIYVNPAFERMTGYSAAEVMGQNFRLLQGVDIHQPGLQELSTAMQAGQDCTVILRNYRQDGSLFWQELNISPVYDTDGYLTHYIGIQTDITNRKQLEQELRVALEKEKELNELKSRFISMTSHEFRTPLSTILSSSELLEHYRHKWTQEKQLTHLRRIQSAVQRITEMLNDILMIGKAEAGKLEYKPLLFDLVAYCRHLVEELQLNLKNQHLLSFSSEFESISCYMDDKLVGHILSNLLSNALKYSPDGTLVKFTLSCENRQAVFEIQDQGIGIPEEDIPRLFESFHRAKNVGNILGTGLGLAIVKKCVDIHQGSIHVISQVGWGTKFTVKLPMKNII